MIGLIELQCNVSEGDSGCWQQVQEGRVPIMIRKFFILGILLYKSLLQYSNLIHITYFDTHVCTYITEILLHVSVCNKPSSGRNSYTCSELSAFHKNITKDVLYTVLLFCGLTIFLQRLKQCIAQE